MTANLTKGTAPALVYGSPLRRSILAGEVLPAMCPVYIHTDGTALKCVSTAVLGTTHPRFDGFVMNPALAIGAPVTVFSVGSVIHLDVTETLVIGAVYWISATAGAISDTKVAANDVPFAKAISTTDIQIIREAY